MIWKEGLAACSRLTLGWNCRGTFCGCGWTGGGPRDLTERFVLSVSPNSACAWLDGGLFAVTSFFGGVGACSDSGGALEMGGSGAPNGPRGSLASSRLSNRVGWAPTLRIALRPPAVREALPEDVVGGFVAEEPAGLSEHVDRHKGEVPTRGLSLVCL